MATGFGKWGMTGSMVSALLLSGLLTGERDPDGAVFDPGRWTCALRRPTFGRTENRR
ncbi:MAG: hypothetical protein ACLSAF_18600 [Intestinimonas sp.]